MNRLKLVAAGIRALAPDPYKSFRFRVKADGHSVAGFGKCTGLATATTKTQPVRLERGVTRDQNFASWISKPTETWATNKRKDLVIEIYNEAGQLAGAYQLNSCRVTKFQGIPNLDANSHEVAIELLELDH